MSARSLLLLILCAACASTPQARPAPNPPVVERDGPYTAARPLPLPISYSSDFQHAIDQGTRTTTGAPGPRSPLTPRERHRS